MKKLIILLLAIATPTTFAETIIHTVIPAKTFHSAGSVEGFTHKNNNFPNKIYDVQLIRVLNTKFIQNNNSEKLDITSFAQLSINFKLNLISYDPFTDTYKFKLTTQPDIFLLKFGGKPISKHVNGDIIFDQTNANTYELTGKFIPIKLKDLPKIPDGYKGLQLGRDEENDLCFLIYSDIPITIRLKD